jgi:hypothetical protein
VPGPKRKLIKGNYHILRETEIPGTITESGFMTNPKFDELSTKPEFAKNEAEAIAQGAILYWQRHRPALETLRDKLAQDRKAKPRDPNTFTATALNPKYQTKMKELLKTLAPDGKPSAERVGEYWAKYKANLKVETKGPFTMDAKWDGQRIVLSGEVPQRKIHDEWIDALVEMRLLNIRNQVVLPPKAK